MASRDRSKEGGFVTNSSLGIILALRFSDSLECWLSNYQRPESRLSILIRTKTQVLVLYIIFGPLHTPISVSDNQVKQIKRLHVAKYHLKKFNFSPLNFKFTLCESTLLLKTYSNANNKRRCNTILIANLI